MRRAIRSAVPCEEIVKKGFVHSRLSYFFLKLDLSPTGKVNEGNMDPSP